MATLRILLEAGAEVDIRSEEWVVTVDYDILYWVDPQLTATLLEYGAEEDLFGSRHSGVIALIIIASLEPDSLVRVFLLAVGASTSLKAQKNG